MPRILVENMPNFDPIIIERIPIKYYAALEAAGGNFIGEKTIKGERYGIFSFDQNKVKGSVWIDPNTHESDREYDIGLFDIEHLHIIVYNEEITEVKFILM